MDSTPIALVLVSALLHATWNLFSKDTADKWGFYVAQGLCAMVLYTVPALWIGWRTPPSAVAAGLALLSIVVHAGYAVHLIKSYEAGDLSVAYPLSRTAPALLALWDAVLLPEEINAAGVAGALLATAGAMTLQLPALRAVGVRAVVTAPVTRYALTAAAFIAAFTVVDKAGVTRCDAFLFLYAVMIGESGFIALRLGREALPRARRQLRENRAQVLFTAVAGPFSYLLTLWALAAAPSSYVLSLRQSSIVFGVLFSRWFLHERETTYRLAGAAIIAIGGMLIALGG